MNNFPFLPFCSCSRSSSGCKSEPLYSRRIRSATGAGSAWGLDIPALETLRAPFSSAKHRRRSEDSEATEAGEQDPRAEQSAKVSGRLVFFSEAVQNSVH
ncbi:hypothetical protein CesoFtcFv8_016886 [Champsocephalus esox]|nr:hypothetical protein CesoFtcFv8_016886 [Champsocephalus esox]KAK5916278.1 hypothetical protein CgunFtcFv8_011279 [Champsocephalus gunnari]